MKSLRQLLCALVLSMLLPMVASSAFAASEPPSLAAPAVGARHSASPAPDAETPAAVVAAPTDWWRSPPALLTTILSGISGLAGTTLALWFGFRGTRSTNNQKANDAELAAIEAKLSSFYGPYLQRSGENLLLASELHARQPEGFRTLTSLLDPTWLPKLSPADRTIVQELVANGEALRDMLRQNAGAVDEAVRPYLARAGTHFTMLILASKGALENDPKRFRRFVYPRPLDAVLAADMERLRARAALLRSKPFDQHAPIAGFVVPPGCDLAPWPEAPGMVRPLSDLAKDGMAD